MVQGQCCVIFRCAMHPGNANNYTYVRVNQWYFVLEEIAHSELWETVGIILEYGSPSICTLSIHSQFSRPVEAILSRVLRLYRRCTSLFSRVVIYMTR